MCDDIGAAKKHKKGYPWKNNPLNLKFPFLQIFSKLSREVWQKGTFFVHVTFCVSVTANGANFVTGRQRTFVASRQGCQRIFIE
jgi:hypothetical protein